MYVYRQVAPDIWEVGFWFHGEWYARSGHTSEERAAARCAELNGGVARRAA